MPSYDELTCHCGHAGGVGLGSNNFDNEASFGHTRSFDGSNDGTAKHFDAV